MFNHDQTMTPALHVLSLTLPISLAAMSFIGGGIEASLAQLAHVQQAAAEGKNRERAAGESARRASDSVLLRVAGLEHSDAVRKAAKDDDDERGKRKQCRKRKADADDHDQPNIDVRA